MGLNNGRLAIKKSVLWNYVLVFGLFYCTILSSLAQFVVPRAKLQLAINVTVVLLFLMRIIKRKTLTKPLLFDVLLILILAEIAYGYLVVRDYEYWAQYRYMLFMVFFLFAMRQKGWHDLLLRVILTAGIIYAILTVWLAFDGGTYRNVVVNLYPNTKSVLLRLYAEHKYAGITDHYSTNGMVLANAIIAAWAYLAVSKRNKMPNIRKDILAFLCILVGLVLTAKRAHLLFTAVACFLAYYIATKKERHHGSKTFIMLLSACAVIVAAYLFIPQVRQVISRFFEMSEDTNIESRYIFWGLAWDAFRKNWLFGIGWFGYRNQIASLANYTGHCHNVYIQLLCETGVVGFSIFLMWFIGSIVIAGLMAYRYFLKAMSPALKVSLLFCLSYQIYFLLYCYSGNPLFDVYQYPLYFVSCIVPMYYYKNQNEIE